VEVSHPGGAVGPRALVAEVRFHLEGVVALEHLEVEGPPVDRHVVGLRYGGFGGHPVSVAGAGAGRQIRSAAPR
jgi:hypothetical protein